MRSSLLTRGGVVVLVSLFAVAACDDPDPPSGPSLTIQDLTAQLAELVGADAPTARAEKTMVDLARQTCKVMAQDGGCDDPLPAAASFAQRDDASAHLLSLLPIGEPRGRTLRREGSDPPVALQPLGATCVWNVEGDGWTGSTPLFGQVPEDRTRFEGYETDPGGPVLPLQRTEDFFDVAPIIQNEENAPRSEVNVELESRRVAGGTLVSLLLAGRINPADGGVIDLLMSGRSGSSAASALDYLFAIDQTRVVNSMELQDLLLISRLDATGSASFFLQKRDDPRQALEFVFRLGGGGATVSSGDVYVGQQRVATMSGDRRSPLFQLIDAGTFGEDANLEFVYDQMLQMDVRVIDLFFFGYCIGANTGSVCDDMRRRFDVG